MQPYLKLCYTFSTTIGLNCCIPRPLPLIPQLQNTDPIPTCTQSFGTEEVSGHMSTLCSHRPQFSKGSTSFSYITRLRHLFSWFTTVEVPHEKNNATLNLPLLSRLPHFTTYNLVHILSKQLYALQVFFFP